MIVQEQSGFANELSQLYLTSNDDTVRLQALKTIANFGVDFKTFLGIQGLVDSLIQNLHHDDDELKLCAAFALKNLGFACNPKQ